MQYRQNTNIKATNHFLVWSRRGATTTHRDAVPACCESFGRQHVRRHQIVHVDPVHPSLRVSESESEQPALHVELIWRRINRNAFLPTFLKFSREFYFMMYRYTNIFQVSIWNQSAVSFKKKIFFMCPYTYLIYCYEIKGLFCNWTRALLQTVRRAARVGPSGCR